uniref:Uncharacterized protein n=1 Tax=Ciona savignyi TaxID=51511 RepID=H2Z131_CIOSA
MVISEVRSQNTAHLTLSCGNDVTFEKGEPGQVGKKGPVGERGMEGPKGAKGEHGSCDPSCRSAYNQLSEKVRRLESTVEILGKFVTLKYLLMLTTGHMI